MADANARNADFHFHKFSEKLERTNTDINGKQSIELNFSASYFFVNFHVFNYKGETNN